MKALFRYLLYTVAFAALIFACKQDDPPKFHFEYFGMEEGRYVIYDVVEIIHNTSLTQHDTLNYQIKAIWKEEYVDNEGRSGREYHLYRRDDATSPWISVDVWHGVIDGIRAELIEENERKVKLVFAPTVSKEWDANAYNTLDEMQCYYRNIHKDSTINGMNYDSTLVVEQAYDKPNLIDTNRQFEMYAKYIGLIYKYKKDNTYSIGNAIPTLGHEYYMSIVESGIE